MRFDQQSNSCIEFISPDDQVPNSTATWGKQPDWLRDGCSKTQLLTYLDASATKGVVTMQHQNLDHPKVISVPLGVPSRSPALWSMLKNDAEHRKCKQVNWIMINLSTWGQRPAIAKRLLRIFPHLTNTYKQGSGLDYLRCVPACTHVLVSLLCMLCVREIKCSRFVVCASGYGPDTYLCLVFRCSACIYTAVPHRYRMWETLVLGAIPVVERRPEYGGWLRVLDELPVLWVQSFDEVTQELLEEQYPSIIQGQYNYKRLTTKWWLNYIAGLLNHH